jgi:VWFA-related protein
MRFRIALVMGLLGVALASGRGDAQAPASTPQQPADQAAAQQPPPVFRTGINFVRVDVIVTDKNGAAVANLSPTDFEIVEEGKPQQIETFKFVELDGGLIPGPDGPPRPIRSDTDEENEAARDDVRLFGIFLDDYHVRDTSSLGARLQISRFIETQLGPSDMVGVMLPLQPVDSVRFTRNHAAVSKGIQQFLGRKFDYRSQNPFEEQYAHYPTEVVERIRNQVSLSALRSMIVHMGSLKEGRKALILVSEGYTNMLPPQMRDRDAQLPGFDNPAAGNPMAGINDPNEARAQAFASFDMEQDLREIYSHANRQNVAIYAVDPRGLATGEFGIDQNIGVQVDREYLNSTMDTLRTLSYETDGRAIVNRNDLTLGMKQIIRDSSSYYLLGYNSTLAASDGKFHEIRVRVKRPGVTVRARRGYWALTALETTRALTPPKPGPPKAVEAALAAITVPPRASRFIRTWIGTGRGENGKTKVTFVWEPIQKPAGSAGRGEEAARVSLTAVAPDGSPYYRGRIPSTPAPASSTAATAPASVTFESAPGTIQLRVVVEGTSAETLDSEIREFVVPDLTSPQISIGTPQVFRARTPRDVQTLKSDLNAIPTAGREFSRTERLFVRVPAWGPANTVPTLTARLLNRVGDAMNQLQVAPPRSPETPFEIEVPLSALAPGEYLIEVSAGDDAKELVGFRVTS